MRRFVGHAFSASLIIFIFYGLFAIFKDSYLNLQDYQFILQMKPNFLEDRRSEMIDVLINTNVLSNRIPHLDERGSEYCILFNQKSNSLRYKNFLREIRDCSKDKTEHLTKELFDVLGIKNEIISGLSTSSKRKFIVSLFSANCHKTSLLYKFNFNEEFNVFLKNGFDSESDLYQDLKNYKYKADSVQIKVILGADSLDVDYGLHTIYDDTNSERSYWIDRKFNLNFFTTPQSENLTYSVLPSVISIFLICVFIVVTIVTISLFLGIYLFSFLDEDSTLRRYFMHVLAFYESLPESILAILSMFFVQLVFTTEKNSVLFIGLILSLIVCPKIVKIVVRSLNLITDSLKNSIKMTDSKVKILINEVLPLITPYVIYRVIKIVAFISNFGVFFLFLSGSKYSIVLPHGFHGIGSSFVSDIFVSFSSQNQHLISSILVVLMCVNLFFYSIAIFVKRFISFQFFR